MIDDDVIKNHYVIDDVVMLYYDVTIFMTNIIPKGIELHRLRHDF